MHSDSGIGMMRDEIIRIFTSFSQGNVIIVSSGGLGSVFSVASLGMSQAKLRSATHFMFLFK